MLTSHELCVLQVLCVGLWQAGCRGYPLPAGLLSPAGTRVPHGGATQWHLIQPGSDPPVDIRSGQYSSGAHEIHDYTRRRHNARRTVRPADRGRQGSCVHDESAWSKTVLSTEDWRHCLWSNNASCALSHYFHDLHFGIFVSVLDSDNVHIYYNELRYEMIQFSF